MTQHLAPSSEAGLTLQPEASSGRLVWQAKETEATQSVEACHFGLLDRFLLTNPSWTLVPQGPAHVL